MISKLPRWVWLGGWLLAMVAGMVNAVGLLGFEHQAVSHMTATTSKLGLSLAGGDWHQLFAMACIVGSFLVGAIFSGWMIQSNTLQLGRHYTTVLIVESILLCAAVILLQRDNDLGIYLCCCACGMQNAIAATYSGAIIRTTHVTGMFTDLGVLLGQLLRGVKTDWRPLKLYTLLISGFLCGGAVSGLLFWRMHYATLLIPAATTASAAIAYRIFLMRAVPAGSSPVSDGLADRPAG